MYEEDANLLLRLPDELAGALFKDVCSTFLTGEAVEYDDPFKAVIYAGFLDKLEINLAAYVATCEKNANNAQARRKKDEKEDERGTISLVKNA